MPLGRKPRRRVFALHLHLLVDSDIHLPVFRSADLANFQTYPSFGHDKVTIEPDHPPIAQQARWIPANDPLGPDHIIVGTLF